MSEMAPDPFHQARQGMFAPLADGVTVDPDQASGDDDSDDDGQSTAPTSGSPADPDWNTLTGAQKSAVNHPGT